MSHTTNPITDPLFGKTFIDEPTNYPGIVARQFNPFIAPPGTIQAVWRVLALQVEAYESSRAAMETLYGEITPSILDDHFGELDNVEKVIALWNSITALPPEVRAYAQSRAWEGGE